MSLALAAETRRTPTPGFPLLTALVVVPAIAAVLVAIVPKSRVDVIRMVGVLGTVATGVLAGYVVTRFKVGEGDYQFVTDHSWIEQLRHPLEARRRRHQLVARRADGIAVPDRAHRPGRQRRT